MTSDAFLKNVREISKKASAKYAAHQDACERIRKENAVLLQEFAVWMRQHGASERTVGMHISNAGFYIQEFLLYEQPLRPHEGVSDISLYLGYWFIRKGPIATPGTVRSNATSLVKFYSFLLERGFVTAEQLDQMRKTIKTEMGHWQDRAKRYNNPAITDQSEIWI